VSGGGDTQHSRFGENIRRVFRMLNAGPVKVDSRGGWMRAEVVVGRGRGIRSGARRWRKARPGGEKGEIAELCERRRGIAKRIVYQKEVLVVSP